MSRTLFENSKAALAFAGMTILGAVMMVGTSDKGGVLTRVDDALVNQRASIAADAQAFAKTQSVGDLPSDAGSGWGKPGAVFSEYNPVQSNPPKAIASPASPAQGESVMTAPLASGAIVADDVDPGVPVRQGVAVITEREMTIEPK